MIKWILISILALGLGFAIYLLIHLGAFKTVVVETQIYPEWHAVYREHRGAYHEISGPLTDIENLLRKQGLACQKTFGHFLDDPATVDTDRLRSHIGCMVSRQDQEIVEGNESLSLLSKTHPTAKVVYARFLGSPAIGPMKVYPAVKEFADRQRVPLRTDAFEIYTVQRDGQVITEYLFVLDSQ